MSIVQFAKAEWFFFRAQSLSEKGLLEEAIEAYRKLSVQDLLTRYSISSLDSPCSNALITAKLKKK
jgi:hypothetical protein